jgi:hypothetical protein
MKKGLRISYDTRYNREDVKNHRGIHVYSENHAADDVKTDVATNYFSAEFLNCDVVL